MDSEIVLPMSNAHPYFSLRNLGKAVHIIHGKIQVFRLKKKPPDPEIL